MFLRQSISYAALSAMAVKFVIAMSNLVDWYFMLV